MQNSKRINRRFRRAALLMLTTAFLLAAPAQATADKGRELPVPQVAQADKPVVTVEGNAVVDSSGKFTGYFELALKVKTGDMPTGANATENRFYYAAVALRYNATVLQPVSWDYMPEVENPAFDPAQPEDDATNPRYITVGTDYSDSSKTATAAKPLAIDTKKDDTINVATAEISGYMPGNSTSSTETEKYDTAQITLTAQAPTEGVVYNEDTILCVVRFKYDKDAYPMEEGNERINFVKGTVGGGVRNTQIPEAAQRPGVAGGFDVSAIWQANDTEAALTRSGQAAWYEGFVGGARTALYHYIGAPAMSASQTRPANVVGAGIALPETVGKAVFSEDASGNYSYTGNLLTPKSCRAADLTADPAAADTPAAGDLVFVLVNRESYVKEGSDPDKMCAILFYDWDDLLIGTCIVQKDQDAREAVNEYIKTHDMIHPDLLNADVTSMTRADNYRGKYPTTPSSATDINSDEYIKIAEKYPLTNKLDYVFLKRPMVHDESAKPDPAVITDPAAYQAALEEWEAKWVQTSEADANDPAIAVATWDKDLPYIHGWAEVPDPAHPEKVWTTLGMGELDLYNGEERYGAYTDIGLAPATLTVQDQKFTFADFDFSENTQTDNVYAVKAVYEPGVDLQGSGYTYTLLEPPYYNKMNSAYAANGGAYEVELILERSAVDLATNNVVGIARVRDPYIREDATTDLKWEADEEKGVDHDLANPSNNEAYNTRTKSQYIRLDVSNSEIMTFSLSPSARHNKLNFFLIEGYGSNFVSGVTRTVNDQERSKELQIVDNYNYYTQDSDETDVYFDATRYQDREGTHGFVLYGTLNSIMGYATQHYNGRLSDASMYAYISVDVLADANLKLAGGAEPTFGDLAGIHASLRTAAGKAKAAYEAGDKQWWNEKRQCADLTYHQVQYAILHGGELLPDATEAAPLSELTWCHLHVDCAAAVSGKPKNWDELIDQARAGDVDNISSLTRTEIEEMTRLRKTDGTAWESAEFAKAIIAAVAAGNTSWDTVQYYIDRGTASPPDGETAASYAQKHYYWYDGSTGVTFTDWNSLSDAVRTAVENSTAAMPDGSMVGAREAKLYQLERAFNLAFPTGDGKANTTQWKNVVHNLRPGEESPFADFEAFVAAIKRAYLALVEAGNAYSDITWAQVQHYLINNDPTITAADAQVEADDKYWWYDFGIKITTLEDLLKVADSCTSADMTPLDQFTFTMLYNNKEFYFAKSFDGTAFQESDMPALREKLYQMIKEYKNTGTDWATVQYYLLHGYGTEKQVENERIYYWWEKGGSAQAYEINTVKDLIEAAFAEAYNGNTAALSKLTEANQMDALRLVKENIHDAPTFAELGHFEDTDIEAIKSSLKALVAAALGAGDHFAPPNLNWYQIQHYFATNKYEANQKSPDLDKSIYWWESGENNPNISEDTPLDVLLKRMALYIQSGAEGSWNDSILIDADSAANWPGLSNTDDSLTFANSNDKLSFRSAKTGTRYTKLTVKSGLQKRIIEISKLAASDPAYYADGKVNLTWYQIQYYIINYKTVTKIEEAGAAKTAVEEYIAGVTKATLLPWKPSWLAEAEGVSVDTMVQMGTVEDTQMTAEEEAISQLSVEISDITWAMANDPANALGYLAELNERIAQLNELLGQVQPPEEEAPPAEELPPVEETDPPVDETDPPAEETDPPVDETDPPAEETDPPVDETDPPAEETDPPVDETDPPAEETDPPVDETDPPETGSDEPDQEEDIPMITMVIPSNYTQLTFRAPSLMFLLPSTLSDSWMNHYTDAWRYVS